MSTSASLQRLQRFGKNMAHVNKQIVANALSLPATEKVELVEILLSSLDEPDKNIDELWAKEVESRIDGYESGEIASIPGGVLYLFIK